MQNFTIHNSLKWYYTSICTGLALIFGSQYFTYKNLHDLSLNNISVTNTIGVLTQTANFGLATKDFQSNMRGYLITHDEELLSDNYRKRVQLVEISDTLFNLVKTDSIQVKKVKELLIISSAIVAFTQKIVTMDRVEGSDTAFSEIKKGEGKQLDKLLTAKIKEIEKCANSGLNQRRRLVLVTQKNSNLFIFITSVMGLFLTILATLFLLRNQRKQRLLQHEINEKERILNQYLEAIPDGVMVINAQQEIVLLNQSGREILGIKSDKMETISDELSMVKLLDPSRYHVRFTSDTLPVTRGLQGEKLTANKINLIKDNKIYHLESNVQPVIGLTGEITSAITVFRDITERANYETTLENARVLAEKSVRAKDIFLSNVSHEIRTPLNAIIGFTNLLVAEVKDSKSADYVNYIQIASKNLLELINDILDFSKIEAGQIILEKTPVSIKDVISSVSVIINQRAAEKSIYYEQIISDDLPEMVETDKLRLSQILLNVCGNAVKFTDKGNVKLIVEPVTTINDSGFQIIRFTVQDTGIGIPQDKLKEVFNRFVQASESTTRIFGGTGLGLSIVKSLVDILDGTIQLHSEVGKGSTFTMEFPMKVITDVVMKDDMEKDIDISTSLSSLRVLAAEDNSLNQKLLQAIFERINISLTVVGNGLEALEILKQREFDLILMDIQMPVMDGYTAIKEIRSTISKTIPIITMTAHAMVGEKEECLSIGANSYISKPFKEKELLYTIAHLGNKENPEPAPPKEILPANLNNMPDKILDLNYLFEITGGDNELRDELIVMFEDESLIQLIAIGQSAGSRDLENLRQSIHKFRSSLFSVGLLATANKYKEIEAILKQGSWHDDMIKKLEDLKAESELGLFQLKVLQTEQSI